MTYSILPTSSSPNGFPAVFVRREDSVYDPTPARSPKRRPTDVNVVISSLDITEDTAYQANDALIIDLIQLTTST